MSNIISATGRRKTSVASVNLKPGTGKITVNGRDFDDYFVTLAQRAQVLQPLVITEQTKSFDIQVRAAGGGLMGQAGATRMAIARALNQLNPDQRPILKSAGFLTRDPRMKERKKAGQPGARKRFQFSKR